MPELPFPSPDGRGRDPGRDETDERIRALLARAVASAPPPPSTDEVRAPRLPTVSVALVTSDRSDSVRGPGTGRAPRSGTARMLRAVAASIAVVVLAVAGARAIGGIGGSRDADERTAMPGDDLPVRYVPTEVPSGLQLSAVDLAAAPAPVPTPEVTVYDGAAGVRVRIAAGPVDWAARTAGPTPNGTTAGTTPSEPRSLVNQGAPTSSSPPTTTTTATPTTAGSPTSPTTTDTTLPPATAPTASPPTTTGPGETSGTGPEGTAPTTTVPALDVASLPNVPGVPGRPDIQATTVRGDVGGIEVHDPTTTTVWFPDRGQLVAVDVFGLDQIAALGVVERLAAGADGRLVPAPEDRLRRVATTPARPAGAQPPAAVQLVYTAPGREAQQGGPAFVVTTTRLAPGADDLLSATVGSFGRIERWGDRQVLVDDGLDNETTTRVSFVDPAGVLVTVLGPSGDLAPYVDGLVAADDRDWDALVAAASGAADVTARIDTDTDTGTDVGTGAGTEPPTSPTTPPDTADTAEPPPTSG